MSILKYTFVKFQLCYLPVFMETKKKTSRFQYLQKRTWNRFKKQKVPTRDQ